MSNEGGFQQSLQILCLRGALDIAHEAKCSDPDCRGYKDVTVTDIHYCLGAEWPVVLRWISPLYGLVKANYDIHYDSPDDKEFMGSGSGVRRQIISFFASLTSRAAAQLVVVAQNIESTLSKVLVPNEEDRCKLFSVFKYVPGIDSTLNVSDAKQPWLKEISRLDKFILSSPIRIYCQSWMIRQEIPFIDPFID